MDKQPETGRLIWYPHAGDDFRTPQTYQRMEDLIICTDVVYLSDLRKIERGLFALKRDDLALWTPEQYCLVDPASEKIPQFDVILFKHLYVKGFNWDNLDLLKGEGELWVHRADDCRNIIPPKVCRKYGLGRVDETYDGDFKIYRKILKPVPVPETI
ncbi:MAG TPA: hypothetical protein ENN60_02605 [archaeon]|nr:hypothetical protein [archaeon]